MIFLDATKRWPFADSSFDAIVCEQMIEHVTYDAAGTLTAEAQRVLRPGGILRVSTPDLRFLADLLDGGDDEYVKWFTGLGKPDGPRNAAVAINRAMRDWGHTFIYDEPTLRGLLAEAGFAHVTRFCSGQSDTPYLVGLEQHGLVAGAAAYERDCLVLEGTSL